MVRVGAPLSRCLGHTGQPPDLVEENKGLVRHSLAARADLDAQLIVTTEDLASDNVSMPKTTHLECVHAACNMP